MSTLDYDAAALAGVVVCVAVSPTGPTRPPSRATRTWTDAPIRVSWLAMQRMITLQMRLMLGIKFLEF
eukprot:scaffold23639_cov191-Amphora_coffeaeformis.AAC.4